MKNEVSTSPRRPRHKVEVRGSPESEKLLRERLASPEGQKLLDELAMVYVEAAVARLMKEAEALHQSTQVPEII
jgi:hypothetical protein